MLIEASLARLFQDEEPPNPKTPKTLGKAKAGALTIPKATPKPLAVAVSKETCSVNELSTMLTASLYSMKIEYSCLVTELT